MEAANTNIEQKDMACSSCSPCESVGPVFLEYEDRLKAFIGKRVKDRMQTEEITQQIFLKIYKNCEQLPQVRNLNAWLYEITRNAVYDFFRENSRLVELSGKEEGAYEMSQDFAQDLEALVRPMIKLLPPEYAEPLLMSELEGISQKEVARKLGISYSGAKSRIQRGREKLKHLFMECCHLEMDRNGQVLSASIRSDCKPLQNLAGEESKR
jgi:RNA polymerase sigma-70 factor, ECF subfamily